jgi:hypothetical protein
LPFAPGGIHTSPFTEESDVMIFTPLVRYEPILPPNLNVSIVIITIALN